MPEQCAVVFIVAIDERAALLARLQDEYPSTVHHVVHAALKLAPPALGASGAVARLCERCSRCACRRARCAHARACANHHPVPCGSALPAAAPGTQLVCTACARIISECDAALLPGRPAAARELPSDLIAAYLLPGAADD